MNVLIDFLIDNYIWFLVITLILVFALIGYLVDTTPKNQNEKVNPKSKNKKEDAK